MTNSEQELQQLNMFLVMPLAVCMFSLGVVINNPSGTAATRSLAHPLLHTAHHVPAHLARDAPGLADPPSIAIMAVTIYAILWVASRIYRVGILMYGKKPSLPEIARWLKYS